MQSTKPEKASTDANHVGTSGAPLSVEEKLDILRVRIIIICNELEQINEQINYLMKRDGSCSEH